jgi:hypothetical protein
VKLAGYDTERQFRMFRNGDPVQARNHSEPEVQHVKQDKEKQDDAGDSLNQVEPVARVRVVQVVGPRFHSDHQTVDGVVDERYKDAANLNEQDVRDRLEIGNRIVEMLFAAERFRVRVKVL